jgi:hypothetical protein
MASSSERKYLNPRDKSLMKPRGDVSLSAFGFLFSEMVGIIYCNYIDTLFIYFVHVLLAVVFKFCFVPPPGFCYYFHVNNMCIHPFIIPV